MARGFWVRLTVVLSLGWWLLPLGQADVALVSEFTVRERTNTPAERRFDLFSAKTPLATALWREEIASHLFEIRNAKGTKFVSARVRKHSWGTEVFINDAQGRRIGHLKERIFEGWIRSRGIWEVRNGKDEILAITSPLDALSTEVALVDIHDGEQMALARPGISLSDYWKIRLSPKLTWDARLLYALSVYRVASDADRRR